MQIGALISIAIYYHLDCVRLLYDFVDCVVLILGLTILVVLKSCVKNLVLIYLQRWQRLIGAFFSLVDRV
jgi:hypothetical protein